MASSSNGTRVISEAERMKAIKTYADKIHYSARYTAEDFEYRHVILPKQLVKYIPSGLLAEHVWRGLGIKQSPGWEMYMRHRPEPHVLLFRRPKDFDTAAATAAAIAAAARASFASSMNSSLSHEVVAGQQ